MIHSSHVTNGINGYANKIQELRLNFMVNNPLTGFHASILVIFQLAANLETNRQVHRLATALVTGTPASTNFIPV
jgi:hypothetical protein